MVSATGNGTVHHAVEAALIQAQLAGVKVLRATRCNDGRIVGESDSLLPASASLNAVKARVELMLQAL